MTNKVFFDLLKSIEKYSNKYNKEVNVVRKIFTAHSAKRDLITSKQNQDIFIGMHKTHYPVITDIPQDQDDITPRIMGALQFEAIILYCRATKTKPIDRQFIPIENQYNDHQKLIHAEIIKYRDQCLAHFGFGHDRAYGYINKETITLDFYGGTTSFRHPNSRANYRGFICSGLQELVPTAIDIANNLALKYEEEFRNIINSLDPDHPIITEINNNIFDPYEFFGNKSDAETFLSPDIRDRNVYKSHTKSPKNS